MKFLLILMLLLAGNTNVFAMETADQPRDFLTLSSYVNAKQGQSFDEQDYAEFDKYLADMTPFALYMNASVLWNLTDSQAVEKSVAAFQSIVDGPYNKYTFPAAAKIAQEHQAEVDNLAQLIAEKLAGQSLEIKKSDFSYPCMCEGESAEYTEFFKDMKLVKALCEKISTLHAAAVA